MEVDGAKDFELISVFLKISRKFHFLCYCQSLVSMNETDILQILAHQSILHPLRGTDNPRRQWVLHHGVKIRIN